MKEEMTQDAVQENGTLVEGRNAVLEAFRSGKTIDKLYVLDGCKDGPVQTIVREARKHDTIINFVQKERLDQLSETGAHQGVIALVSAHDYVEVEDILAAARAKGEDPFIILLDGITDPHNLGAILRTAECAGAHGVIIPKRRSVGLNATVGKTSAGAIEYMPVAKVTNLVKTMEQLKKEGLWFACADMGENDHFDTNLKGPIGLVIGSGMYEIGIYGTLMTLIVLEVFRQLSNRLIGHHHSIIIQLVPASVSGILLALQQMRLKPGYLTVNQHDADTELCEMSLDVTLRPKQDISEVYQRLQQVEGVHFIDIR